MIKEIRVDTLKELNKFLINNAITKKDIISVHKFFDRANTNWKYFYELLYYDEYYLETLEELNEKYDI